MENHEREQEIGLYLARRAYVYNLMHVMFGAEPSAEVLSATLNAQTLDAIGAVAKALSSGEHADVAGSRLADEGPTLEQCVQDAAVCIEKAAADAADPSFVAALRSDFAKLFEVPGESYVHLWESSYIGREGMLFQESTLDVRAFYHDAGFKLQAEKRFPDDHIAAMADYMGRMSQRAYDAFADGEDYRARQVLSAQRLFAERHLLTWIDAFASKARECDTRGVYAAFATVMAAFVHLDIKMANAIDRELDA